MATIRNSPNTRINWLIATPESLNSLLCRRPKFFRTLRTVILDEIHVLDAPTRDQVRVLLQRLRQATDAPSLSVHLLSATLPDPAAIAKRYVDGFFQVITVKGSRPIEAHLAGSTRKILRLAQEHHWRKLLCFCNTRRKVEETAAQVSALWKPYPGRRPPWQPGSLPAPRSRGGDEAVWFAVCVATSTLEIGIDIGDIDLECFAATAMDPVRLQQRIGPG